MTEDTKTQLKKLDIKDGSLVILRVGATADVSKESIQEAADQIQQEIRSMGIKAIVISMPDGMWFEQIPKESRIQLRKTLQELEDEEAKA